MCRPHTGAVGQGRLLNLITVSPQKIGRSPKASGQKEKGVWGKEFLPACLPAEGGMGWESVSAIPAKAGRQNRNIFVSLIEKNFGGARIKKCKENFSVLLAVRRTETRGGIQSAKSSGFCSKWVRISSNKHHHNEFEECSASPSPAARAAAGRLEIDFKKPFDLLAKLPAEARGEAPSEATNSIWWTRPDLNR